MPLYFYVLDRRVFLERIHAALARSWQTGSFACCEALARELTGPLDMFRRRFHVPAEDLLLSRLPGGVSFDRDLWRLLVGELLLVTAVDIPELETAPETLIRILDRRPPSDSRAAFSPIEQAHFGTRDLLFGIRYYRPEHAGWNDLNDVRRLSAYLRVVTPDRWTVADLTDSAADDKERAEELEYAREWFPALVNLYHGAEARGNVVICETL